MKSLVDHLSQYAAYHRDPRNIASHFIGIPLIVVAVAVLLSRPEWSVGGLWLSPAVLLALFSAWFYLRKIKSSSSFQKDLHMDFWC